ncbi:hypothetical protein PoB_005738000 [Plakobranchus ocellatus]|uniref:Uncharacterized protein n=1 Tax=Plakobranchus ocellatus TaxID=259542 RepID=A0AAV4CGM2_9GAST|nr:hypothetical protein PoB_005738000 [Plakobranchus ocellatus]
MQCPPGSSDSPSPLLLVTLNPMICHCDFMKIGEPEVIKYMIKVYNEVLKLKEIPICCTFKDKNRGGQDTLPEKKTKDGQNDAQSGNQGQEEETGADRKQDGWMTSGSSRPKMAEEGTRSEEMEDICRGLHPAVDGQSLQVTNIEQSVQSGYDNSGTRVVKLAYDSEGTLGSEFEPTAGR